MAENMARGQLRIATEIERQARVSGAGDTFTLPANGLQQDFAQLSDEFGRVSAKIGAWADKAAANEGAQAGHLAGLDPEFRPGRTNTIRGEAFDAAGLATYKAKTLTGLHQDLEDTYDKHHADPVKLRAVLAEKTKGWLANTLPDVRPEVELEASKGAFTALRRATREQIARQQADLAAATQLEVAQSLKSLQQRAMTLGLDPKADEILASDLKGLEARLTRRGPNGMPLVSPAQARVLLEGAREDLTTARLMGTYGRLESLEAKEKFVDGMRAEFEAGKGLSGQYNLDQFRKAENLMRAELRRDVAEERIGTRVLGQQLEHLKRNAEQGVALPDGQMRDIEAQVAMSRDPRVQQTYLRARETLNFHQEARRQTPQELDRYIEQQTRATRAEGAPESELHKLEVARKLRTSMTEGLDKDPLGWATQVGLVVIPPLDMTSPAKAVASLQARGAVADTVGEIYHRPARYFRPDEVRALNNVAAQGPRALVETSQSIMTALGPEKGLAALRELGRDAPEVAIIGGMAAAGADGQAIEAAANGMALRRLPDYKSRIPDLSAGKTRLLAAEVYGHGFAASPQTQDGMTDAAQAIYETRARRHGWTTFNDGEFRKALREAAGENTVNGSTFGGLGHDGSGTFGGRRVHVPTWLRQDSVRTAVKALTVEDLTKTGDLPTDDSGRPLEIRRLHAAKLVSVGHGRYHLALTDPDGPDPQYVGAGRTGERYVLDLNRHRESLRQRLGGLVLGGDAGGDRRP